MEIATKFNLLSQSNKPIKHITQFIYNFYVPP